ncbi:MAG: SdiA-regulated domain-containing protein [Sedimentisphaerales bacterium]|nr:SdiA-regulated domain-containing protein [Sedimentisphaerales bacterium]
MLVCKKLAALIIILSALFLTGCGRTAGPRQVLDTIVFPNEWVGNIDKIEFNEPSGICWHAQRGTLFVVGDEGDLCEITTEGTLVKQRHLRDAADFEGITYDPSTGLLYLAIEEAEAILEVHPETFELLREFSVPRTFAGKTLLAAGGEGLEGITFIPDAKHKEGGVFYVGNQAFTLSNPEDISAVFRLELPLRTQTGPVRITGYFEPGIIDVSGLNHDATTDRILVVSDATNTMLEYTRDERLLNVWAFPGDNQEGVTVDDEGFIYIAQDTGGIIKLKWLR